jgi:hypothetical protein
MYYGRKKMSLDGSGCLLVEVASYICSDICEKVCGIHGFSSLITGTAVA